MNDFTDPAFQARLVELVPQQAALGLQTVALGLGDVTLFMPYAEQLIGFPDTGVIAGGAIFTLMDSACGLAVMTALTTPQPLATMDLRIDYLKPATPGLGVHGQAACYKMTRRIAFVRGIAYHDDSERPIAHVTGTFILGTAKDAKS